MGWRESPDCDPSELHRSVVSRIAGAFRTARGPDGDLMDVGFLVSRKLNRSHENIGNHVELPLQSQPVNFVAPASVWYGNQKLYNYCAAKMKMIVKHRISHVLIFQDRTPKFI